MVRSQFDDKETKNQYSSKKSIWNNNSIFFSSMMNRIYDEKHYKQECSPVGCVLPTLVPTTRCQFQGGLSGGRSPLEGDLPGRNMGPDSLTGSNIIPPLERTWDQAARQEVTSYTPFPHEQTTYMKTLPSPNLVGGQ